MGHVPLIDELAIIAAVAVAVTVVLSRLKLPTVAGLLLAGALVGPYGLGLARSIGAIEELAEVGVVLLLFTIGLEFSLTRLKDIFSQAALGGLLQIGLTTVAAVAIGAAFGLPPARGIFYGFVFALSSTAIVLRALAERGELDAPHGRFIVGTLIFQDLCVVPMVLIVPFLGHEDLGNPTVAIAVAIGKAAGVVVATVGIARLIVPRVLTHVDMSRSREVFLLAILGVCIGAAWLTSALGLSLALGAFLGGMLVADTEYGHRAFGDVLPLRDAFVSVFFVSLGMLFDVRVVIAQPLLVGGLLGGLVLAKGLLATLAAAAMRFPRRVAWLAGVGLAQFGEFGFVLARLGQAHGVVTEAELKPVLAAGIASMFLTPILVRAAPHVRAGERLLAPLEKLIGVRSIVEAQAHKAEEPLENHVVIVGFGLAGRMAARSLQACGSRYLVLELNAETVRTARAAGLPVYYGDATSPEALEHAHLAKAAALVLLMNDPRAAQRVVDTAKRVAPEVPVLMRARYLLERQALLQTGARDVVAEEVEGAVEIIARLLRWLEVPRNVIDDRIREVRTETQSSDRKLTLPRPALSETTALGEMKIESFLVREGTVSAGKSAVQLELRRTTGALVVGVKRGDRLLDNPDPTVAFQPGDVLFLVGTSEAVRAAIGALSAVGTE